MIKIKVCQDHLNYLNTIDQNGSTSLSGALFKVIEEHKNNACTITNNSVI
ncbi:hypothetical protein COPG_00143 [Colwellia phage 9A]|uniref:Uncharacterized protein n=1 Tax=Colwellia phage 9A TaxID=765765 RepID=I3UMM4_9CAUD|nr:hypothetical protein COPG_00143 [Colwellia phage 9A]AFK66739.1 hypothetical protein COPG_00143 [Colwellia phage 9A]